MNRDISPERQIKCPSLNPNEYKPILTDDIRRDWILALLKLATKGKERRACVKRPMCFYCGHTTRYFFKFPDSCHRCKIDECYKNFTNPLLKRKWSECDHPREFIFELIILAKTANGRARVLQDMFGVKLYHENRENLLKLMRWANHERKENGDTFPSDFGLIRFEHAFKKTPGVMNFWLTLCAAFELCNYLDAFREYRSKWLDPLIKRFYSCVAQGIY
jgi:hypothetical protein